MSMSGLNVLRMLLLGLALILTSCATMGTSASGPEAVRRTCEAWPYTSWSEDDTKESIRDAKANNAAKDAFCGKPSS